MYECRMYFHALFVILVKILSFPATKLISSSTETDFHFRRRLGWLFFSFTAGTSFSLVNSLSVVSIHHRDIHSLDRGIQVHSIHHREDKDQHQPWVRHQQTSFRSKHRDTRDIHIQDHGIQVHSIHHTRGRDQHQPWAQHQHQQTSCHSKHRDIRGIHIQVRDNQVHSIHHKAGRGQHQLLAQPQPHAFHSNDIHRQDSGIQHILEHDHSTLHTEDRGQHQPWP